MGFDWIEYQYLLHATEITKIEIVEYFKQNQKQVKHLRSNLVQLRNA